MRYATIASFVFVAVASAAPLSPDPAGAKNVGNGNGGQFITGQCLSDKDCASGCCATLGNIGICSGPAVSFAQGKSGCGFGGNGQANAPAQQAPPPQTADPGTGLKPDPAGAKNVGNGNGGQFITGQCLSDKDCASGCCAKLGSIGICSGPAVSFAQGKQGCGFGGNAQANAPAQQAPPPQTADPGTGLKPDPAGAKNVGNGNGGQFITGQCLTDKDCASGCCAKLGSIGICSGPAVSFAQGKQGCGFGGNAQSNAPAQQAPPPQTADPGTGLKPDPAGVKNIGNGNGGQFITGQCLSDADCGSGCCAKLGSIGICSGPAVSFAQGKQGCGFRARKRDLSRLGIFA